MMPVDQQLLDALATLWRIPPPGPINLSSAPAFTALSELCAQRYGGGKTVCALSNALQSLGLPCRQPLGSRASAFNLLTVAERLVEAYSRKTTVRRYICPLDLADDLPSMAFGTARIAQFCVSELEQLFDYPRLARHFPTLLLESQQLAQFHWLVVEEEVTVDPRLEGRALPFLSMDMSRDFGEIEPHLGRFPKAVEDVLFFLLLAPWEDWSMLKEADWRGFRMPWIYTLDEDLFVAPSRPPSSDSLTLEPCFVQDNWGEEIELERPTVLPLDSNAITGLQFATDTAWAEWQSARTTPLFETPVVHFLVRAFLADGVDEFIAHLTVIEAALGLESDHRRRLRPKPDPYRNLSPTERVATRLSAALGDDKAMQDYKDLFDLRSAFIHGRAGMQRISTSQRILARSLARRTTCALVALASHPALTREECLSDLLAKGISSLRSN